MFLPNCYDIDGPRPFRQFIQMRLNIFQDTLIRMIQAFGVSARDHRQVQKRLEQVLPDRLKQIIFAKQKDHGRGSQAMREALVSDEFLKHVDELVDVSHKSRHARIQYETHLMLFECRRSLNRHNHYKKSSSPRRNTASTF